MAAAAVWRPGPFVSGCEDAREHPGQRRMGDDLDSRERRASVVLAGRRAYTRPSASAAVRSPCMRVRRLPVNCPSGIICHLCDRQRQCEGRWKGESVSVLISALLGLQLLLRLLRAAFVVVVSPYLRCCLPQRLRRRSK
ncbi:hypothetical protein MTO96_011025 [Rhipicephalus appendiculatus]